ncbi:MAG: hypothetical protein PGN13_03965 [Patulibacter minatonensis]
MSQPAAEFTTVTAEEVEAVQIVVTDEEFAVLFESAPGALARVFPDDLPTPGPPVRSAIRRSLVARRALWDRGDGSEVLVAEPWASLLRLAGGASPWARVTASGEDARAAVFVAGAEELLVIERDPRGINTVTFLPAHLTAAAVAEALIDERGELDVEIEPAGSVMLLAEAFDTGAALLAEGHEDEARAKLGPEAFTFVNGAGAHFRLETSRQRSENEATGLDVSIYAAYDMGWVLTLPVEGAPEQLELRSVDDEGLVAFIGEQLLS